MQATTQSPSLLNAQRLLAPLGALLIAAVLAGCGGGNGDPCGLGPPCATTGTPGGATNPGGTTTPKPVPVASDISLVLSANTLLDNGTDTVTATVTAVDQNRNALAGAPVTVRVDANAIATVASDVTDTKGVVTATIGVGADRVNRVITVTAISGSLTRTASVQVTGAKLVATALPAKAPPATDASIRFRLTDVTTRPIVGQAIVVSGAGGAETSGTTDNNGEYVYRYRTPTATGTLSIRASAGGTTVTQVVQVLSTSIPKAQPGVESASVALYPAVIPVNSEITDNQVEVRALFLRDTNKPAEDIRVRFDLGGNTSDVPGTLASGDSLVYSDSTGVARTSYKPGNRSSPTDGVVIRACWDYQDFALGSCPFEAKATLTVAAESISVSIGTDNLVGAGSTQIDYVKRFLVQVNDASGAPVEGARLAAVVDLPGYLTGYWKLVDLDWVQVAEHICDNEDLDRNGAIDVFANGAREDANGNGRLDPRKADVVARFEGDARTDIHGQAVLVVTYPQSSGSWIRYDISVVASGVAGTEGRARASGILPVLDKHIFHQDPIRPPPPPAFIWAPSNPPGWLPPELRPIASPPYVDPIVMRQTVNPDGRRGMLCTVVSPAS